MTAAKSLVQRRVPHICAAYGGGALGFLYFVEYVVGTFVLSPHWNRVALVLVLSLIPSVLLLAYNHGPPGKDPWTRAEKIGVPANLIVAIGILTAMFGGTDLGAATTSITVENEDGEEVVRVVAKPEFRKRTAVFTFDAAPGVAQTDSWISYLVPSAISLDLAQDPFVELIPDAFLQQQLESAGYPDLLDVPLSLKRQLADDHYAGYLIVGEVGRSGDGFRVAAALHEASTGREVHRASFAGQDLLTLVDSVAAEITEGLELPSGRGIENLPVRERLTHSPAALESYGRGLEALLVRGDWGAATGHLATAVNSDATFAVAQHSLAVLLLFSSRSQEALAPMQRALDNAYKLPERLQFPIKVDYFFATQQYHQAWSVVEMWAEIHPEDPVALQNLMLVRQMRGDRSGALATLQALHRLNPGNRDLLRQIAQAQESEGMYDEALARLEEFVGSYPEDPSGHASLSAHHLLRGDFSGAREHLERALLLAPSDARFVTAMGDLDRMVGAFDDARGRLDEALSLASSPQERASVWASLRTYHEHRGELGLAADAIENRLQAEAAFEPPFRRILQPRDVDAYFAAGRGEDAIALVTVTTSELQSPFDVFGRLTEVEIALQRGLLTEARASLRQAEIGLADLGLAEGSADGMARARGRIAERDGDLEAALQAYQSRIALNLGSSAILASVHRDVGLVLMGMGRVQEAETATLEALRLSPADGLAHLQLARLAVRRERQAEAARHAERALEIWAGADASFEPAHAAREIVGEPSR